MAVLVDQHGFPITSEAEAAEVISRMPYEAALETLRVLDDNINKRAGLFSDEEDNWKSLDDESQDSERDYVDLDSVQRASQLAYNYWVYNPLIRRGVDTISQYVFGRGFSITAEDEGVRQQAQQMWAEYDVQRQMSGAQGIQRHCSLGQVHGNLFFALYPPGRSARKIRRFEMSQIQRVIYDRWGDPVLWLVIYRDPLLGPDAQPTWEWVKSIHYRDRQLVVPEGEEDYPITDEYYMQHMTFGSLIGPLGLPTFWPGIPWAKAYKAFLEDFAVISRSYRTFAWKLNGNNMDSLQTSRSMISGAMERSDRSTFGVGQVATMPAADLNMAPIRTSNYTTPADGGRRLALMCMAAFGLPETYFSDVSVGTYATASSMERPVELMMRYVQEVWSREMEIMLSFLIDGDAENQKEITVTFPPILEHDLLPSMQALKTIGELEYQSVLPEDIAVHAMQSLGIQDIEERLERMRSDGYFETTHEEMTLQLQKKYAPDPAPQGGGGSMTSARSLGGNYPRRDRPRGQGMPRPSNGR